MENLKSTEVSVVSVTGDVIVVNAQGEERLVKAGEAILPGEMIITPADGELALDTGKSVAETVPADSGAFLEIDPATGELVLVLETMDAGELDVAAIQQAILQGQDPTEILEETAAGQGSREGFSDFQTIERTADEVIASSGYDTAAGENGGDTPVGIEETELPAPPQLSVIDMNGLVQGENTIVETPDNTVGGGFTLSVPGGLRDIQIDGVIVTEEQLLALTDGVAIPPITTSDENGVLTLSSYDSDSGVIGFTYEVSGAKDHSAGDESVVDNIPVIVSDKFGQKSDEDSLDILITDTVAIANDDAADAPEDTAITVDVLANDDQGADGAIITDVTEVPDQGIVSYNDSEITFEPNPGFEGAVEIPYTITDSDGDSDDAVLIITVAPDSEPEFEIKTPNRGDDDSRPDGADVNVVHEQGLLDSADASSIVVDEFVITTGNDTVASLTIAGNELVESAFPINVTTGLGNALTILSFDSDTGVIRYSYEVLEAETHPDADGHNVLQESFPVVVEDSDGDVLTSELSILIVDDVPVANDDFATVMQGTEVTVNVIENDYQGADGARVTAAVVSLDIGSVSFNDSEVNFTPAGGFTGVAQIEYTIVDADGDPDTAILEVLVVDPPKIIHVGDADQNIDDVVVNEGDAAVFTVVLDKTSPIAMSYDIALADGTAVGDADYGTSLTSASFSDGVTINNGVITVPAGVASFTVSVPTITDALLELPSENFTLTVDEVVGTGHIVDPYVKPSITHVGDIDPSIDSVTVPEATTAVFTVNLSSTPVINETYSIALADGTATGGDVDYTSVLDNASFSNGVSITAGVITVPAGVGTFTVAVPTIPDSIDEISPETFTLTVGGVTGTGNITDDDGVPTITHVGDTNPSIDSVTVPEGTDAVFTVNLSNPSSSNLIYGLNLQNGSAISGDDYNAGLTDASFSNGVTISGGNITVPAGVDTFTVTVPTINDNIDEPSPETFTLTVGGVTGTGNITDDDGVPTITHVGDTNPSIDSVTVPEGTDAVFTVNLSNPSSSNLIYGLNLQNGSATSGDDYNAGLTDASFSNGVTISGGNITVPAGVDTFTVTVPTINDNIDEPSPETFTLTVGGVTGTGNITDDDGVPTITHVGDTNPSIDSVTVPEGTDAVFTVNLSNPSSSNLIYGLNLQNGSATSGDDYDAGLTDASFSNGVTISGGNITVPAGVDTFTVTVPTINDNIDEPSPETFTLTVGGVTGTGNITDNDGTPTITHVGDTNPSIDSVTVPEGTDAVFTVNLSNPSSSNLIYGLNLQNGSATSGDDYNAGLTDASFSNGVTISGGNITVPAGVDSFTVTVPTINDNIDEPSPETFTLTVGGVTGTGNITDNDAAPTLAISGPATVNESAGTVTYTVTLTGESASDVTVNVASVGGTATLGTDFGNTSLGNLTFPANGGASQSLTVTVPITEDTTYEGDETYSVVLSGAVGATISSDTVITTINDTGGGTTTNPPTDDTPTVSVVMKTGEETAVEAGTDELVYVISLTNPSKYDTTVEYTLSGQATEGDDYPTITTKTVTIPAGSTSVEVAIDPTADGLANEGNESVIMTLDTASTNGTGLTITTPSATGTIIDSDSAPTLAISGPATVNESAGTVTYTVTLTGESASDVTVNVASVGGTATLGTDFGNTSLGNLTFPANGGASQSLTVTVPITEDTTYEGDETYSVVLSGAVGATISSDTVITTINDTGGGTTTNPPTDDTPTVSVVMKTGEETAVEAGTDELVYVISLTNPSKYDTTVEYTLSGQATEGDDYPTITTKTVTIPAGSTSVEVAIDPTADGLANEGNESVIMTLDTASTNGTGLTITTPSATGTIIDSDSAPTLAISGPATVNESAGTVTYTVTLTGESASDVTVNVASVGGTATLGTDFGNTSLGNLTFPANGGASQSLTVTVPITEDTTYEGDETYSVVLSGAVGATISSDTVITTINDTGGGTTTNPPTDDTPTVSVVMKTGEETAVEAGTDELVYVISLTNPSKYDTTVEYTLSGQATEGDDYPTITTKTVTIPAGSTSVEVAIDPTADGLANEGNESVIMTLDTASTNGTGLTITTPSATGTIIDSDSAPTLAISGPATVNESAGTVTYTVTLTGESASDVTVNVASVGGTATLGTDFGNTSLGNLTFPANGGASQSLTVTVPITEDTTYEGDETYSVVLSGAVGATISSDTVITTINDTGGGTTTNPPTDDTPTVSVVMKTGEETAVEAGTDELVYVISLTNPSKYDTTVEYTLSGQATEGDDYPTITTKTVTIPAGSTSVEVAIDPTADGLANEGNESVIMTLDTASTNGTGLTITTPSATGTIIDSDSGPTLAISGPATVNESAGTVTYTVTLTGESASDVTVNVASVGGTATLGTDFGNTSLGNLTFPANGGASQSLTVTVPITEDTTYEGDETYSVVLSGAVGATISSDTVITTINDTGGGTTTNPPTDDTPTVSVVMKTGEETAVEAGTDELVYVISLTNPSKYDTTVEYTLSGQATEGDDYPTITTKTVTIPAGSTSVEVAIDPTADGLANEGNESVIMTLDTASTNGTGLTITTPSATGTIIDSDSGPTLAISGPATVNESAGTVTYTVTLTGESASDVTVNVASVGGTATLGTDFGNTSLGNLTFPANGGASQSLTVTVPITEDTTYEGDETYSVVLSGAVGATISSDTVITTINDTGGGTTTNPPTDDTPTVSVVMKTGEETAVEAGTDELVYVISLTNPSKYDTTVEYTLSGQATEGDDYPTITTKTVTIPAGSTSVEVAIDPTADGLANEGNESVIMTLDTASTNGTGLTITTPSATGTIIDSDSAPTLAISGPATVNESAGTVTYTVTLTGESASDVTVNVASVGGTATLGTDFGNTSLGNLTFPANGGASQSLTVTVPITEDTTYEGDETYSVVLSGAVGATISSDTVITTINDTGGGTTTNPPTDDTPTVSVVMKTGEETAVEAGTDELVYVISLTNPSKYDTTVEYTLSGQATEGDDYPTITTKTVTIPAGSTSVEVAIDPTADGLANEGNESVIMTLDTASTNGTGLTITTPSATGTIIDSDSGPTLAISGPATVNESAGTVTYTVTLTGESASDVTVNVASVGGTATLGTDFGNTSLGNLTFPANGGASQSLTVTVPITEDTTYEGDETYSVVLSGAVGATISSDTVITTINDTGGGTTTNPPTDDTPTVSVVMKTGEETAVEAGTDELVYVISLTNPSKYDTTVEYTLSGQATEGDDYPTITTKTVTIPAGSTSVEVAIDPTADGLANEGNESVIMTLDTASTNGTGLTITTPSATGTIIDSDSAPTLAISGPATVNESAGTVTYTVTLTGESASDVTVNVASVGGTATLGTDFGNTSLGNLTFPANGGASQSLTVTVPITEDTTYEGDETYSVVLSGAVGATISSDTVITTINDTGGGTTTNPPTDDTPTVSVVMKTGEETAVEAGTDELVYVISLTNPSKYDTTVEYTLSGQATEGDDYPTITTKTVTIPAGSTSVEVAIDPTADGLANEGNESVIMTLDTASTNGTGLTITTPSATGTIIDSDSGPTLAISGPATVNESAGTVTYTVTLTGESASDVTVNVASVGGTATLGTDFGNTSLGNLTFPANGGASQSLTVTVPITEDTTYEGDETYSVVLSGAVGATISSDTVITTINDTGGGTTTNPPTDDTPTVSVVMKTGEETAVEAGTDELVYVISLTNPSKYDTTVEYTLSGQATEGDDYPTITTKTVTIPAGSTSVEVAIDPTADGLANEGNESVIMTLDTASTNGTGLTITTPSATGTIIDSDSGPTLAISGPATVNESAGTVTYTVTLTGESASDVTVNVASVGGTATLGTDFGNTSLGNLTFPANGGASQSLTVTVPITEDTTYEGDETYSVVLSGAVGATISSDTVITTINDTGGGTTTNPPTDDTPTVSVVMKTGEETAVEAGTDELVYVISLTNPSKYDTTVEYTLSGQATEGDDYPTITTKTVTIPAGSTSVEVAIDPTADGLANEGNESVIMTLDTASTNGTGLTITTPSATGTIIDSDSGPTLAISGPATVNESAGTVTYTVTLTGESASDVTVNVASVGGTATLGTDFGNTSLGNLTFPANGGASQSLTVTVPITEDTTYEGDETYSVVLSGAVGATISSDTVITTINDTGGGTTTNPPTDDTPTVSVVMKTGEETAVEAGTDELVYVISLTNPSKYDTTVEYTLSGQATEGDDYPTITTKTVTIPAGSTSVEVAIDPTADGLANEGNESVIMTLDTASTNGTGLTITTPSATGTIIDSDSAPTLAISGPATVNESAGTVTYTVTLTGESASDVTVNVASVGGTATLGTDFGNTSLGNLTFPANGGASQSLTVTVPITEDTTYEGDETYSVVLSGAVGATISSDTVITTINDTGGGTTTNPPTDDTPTVSVVMKTGEETAVEAGTDELVYVISLTNPSKYDTTVEYTLSGQATEGDDYPTITTKTVTIPAGSTSVEVAIDPTADGLANEGNESVIMTLDTASTNGTGLTITTPSATGTIIDSDSGPTLAISGPATVNESAGTVTYTVTLTGESASDVTVNVASVGGTATLGTDFGNTSLGNLTFPANGGASQSLTVTVPITEDTTYEGDETYSVVLSGAVGATISSDTVITTINDTGGGTTTNPPTDDTPTVSVVMKTGEETAVEAGTDELVYVISLTNPSKYDTTVEYTLSGQATEGDDYPTITTKTVTIPAGSTSVEVAIDPTADGLANEGNESVIMTLDTASTNGTGLTITTPSATGTIIDSDSAPTLAISGPATVNESAGTVTYTVTLTGESASDVTVNVASVGGTATLGTDFGNTSLGNLTFPANGGASQSLTVTVPITEDTTYEGDETYSVVLSGAVGATISSDTVITTINDTGGGTTTNPPTDDTPTVSVVMKTGEETAVEAGTDELVYVISLTNPSKYDTTVEYTLSGQATEGDDYPTITTKTVTIPAGSTSVEVAIDPTADGLANEGNESVIMTLDTASTNGTGLTITTPSATGTIIDSDSGPTLAISGPATVNESAGTVTYTVTLTGESASDVTVNVASVGGTATLGTDFGNTSLGNLTFPANGGASQSLTVTVPITEDTTYEGDETYSVVLSGAVGATISSDTVITTINDTGGGTTTNPPTDDTPTVSVVMKTGEETAVEAGTDELVYVISLTNPSKYDTTVEYTLSGQATEGDDYPTITTKTVTIPAGSTSVEVAIDPTADGLANEGNESVIMTLDTASTNGTGLTITTPSATGTIIDSDSAPTLAISGPATVNESAGTVTYTVTLTGESASDVTVNVASVGGTATLGTDFGNTSLGNLTFPANGGASQSLTVTVPITEDTTYEGDETYSVVLSGAVGATISSDTVITTINDTGGGTTTNPPTDDTPTVSVVMKTGEETAVEAGTDELVYVISLTNPSKYDTTVEYTLSGQATEGDDYPTITTKTVTIPAGSTSVEVAIDPTADGLANEGNESVIMTLDTASTNGTGLTITTPSATGTIIDSDSAPTLAISGPATVNESAGTVTYTVTLTGESASDVTVNVASVGGTATLGTDFGNTSLGNLTFPANGGASQSLTVTVPITEDTTYEGDETYSVVLSGAVGATISSDTVITTINDTGGGTTTNPPTDDTPTVSVVMKTGEETAVEAGTDELVYVISLTNPSKYDTTVEYTLSGQATEGDDYPTITTKTVTIPAGSTSVEVAIDPTADGLANEGNESVIMTLDTASTNGTGLTITTPSATGTIIDSDSGPTLAISGPATVNESAGTVTYTVTLTGESASDVTVNVASVGGTATLGTDFGNTSLGNLTFPANGGASQSLTVTVPITEDTTYEGDETYSVVLSGAVGATISSDTVITTINDTGGGTTTNPPTDDTPTVSVVMKTGEETAVEAGTDELVYVISLTNPSKYDTTVEYTLSGQATEGDDYPTITTKTVTIPAGSTSVEVAIDPTADGLANEGNESVIMTLDTASTNGTGLTITTPSATGTIIDSDSAPTLAISGPATVNESAGTVTYTVTMTGSSATDVTVDIASVADGTAVKGDLAAGGDFGDTSLTSLTFTANQPSPQTLQVTVPITEDAVYEGDETFSVALSNESGATVTTRSVGTTITDNDVISVTDISDPKVQEGNPLVFDVTLSGERSATSPAVPVTLTLAGVTADLAADIGSPTEISFDNGSTWQSVTFTAGTATVNLPEGADSIQVRLPTIDDADDAEGIETLTLSASTPENSVPVVGTGAITEPDAIDDYGTLTGLRSEYYGYHQGPDGGNLEHLAQIRAFIDANDPDATFIAQNLSYNYGSGSLGLADNLQTFLGSDAASLSTNPDPSSDAILSMKGYINLDPGSYRLSINADDGYSVLIDGVEVARVDQIQSPTLTPHDPFIITTGGYHKIEILYWDQGGGYVFQPTISKDGGAFAPLNSYDVKQGYTTEEDTALSIPLSEILANDTDPEGDTLTVTGVSNPVNGTVQIVGGNAVFTPDADYFGPAQFDYSISDGNGGVDTATVFLDVTPVNDAPVVTVNTSISLNEDGLPGGIPGTDGTGTPGPTSSVGQILVSDPDAGDTLTVSIVDPSTITPTLSLTSGGDVVNFSLSADGKELIGYTGADVNSGEKVFTFTVDDTGAYSITLHKALDHTQPANDDTLSFPLTVSASDGRLSTEASISVTVTDDTPITGAVSQSVVVPDQNSNLMFVIDTSGSMGWALDGNRNPPAGQSRMEILLDSIENLINSYDQVGEVRVQIVTFNSNESGHETTWMTAAQALTFIGANNGTPDASLAPGGGTNYDLALSTAEAGFTVDGKLDPMEYGSLSNISYFLSDGLPQTGGDYDNDGNSSQGIDGGERIKWENCTTANEINSFAVGFTTGASPSTLQPIGYNGAEGTDPAGNVLTATTAAALDATLQSTLPPPVSGSLFGQIGSGTFGTDSGDVVVITVGSDSYSYNATTGLITKPDNTTEAGPTIDIPIGSSNASININFDTAVYQYTAATTLASGGSDVDQFTYETIDSDGDSASGTITLNVSRGEDSDGDGILNTSDADDDNDGILDTAESGFSTTISSQTISSTNSGSPDSFEISLAGVSGAAGLQAGDTVYVNNVFARGDINGNGSNEAFILTIGGQSTVALSTVRNNGTEDSVYRSVITPVLIGAQVVTLSSGQLGIVIEGYKQSGVSGNVDFYLDISTNDVDGDGIINSQDTDSDNDGLSDTIEAQTNATYQPPTGKDDDNDGIDNRFEGSPLTPVDDAYLVANTPDPTGATATNGDDRLLGDSGNNTIDSLDGIDILVGGAGDDILIGGAGRDVFVWNGGDQGSSSAAVDTVREFNVSEDLLDLSDLLDDMGMSTGGVIEQYLSLTEDSGNVKLSVKEGSGGAVTQEIVLENVSAADLKSDLGLAPTASDNDLLNQLISESKLIV